MEIEKLKVGDKLYIKQNIRYSSLVEYTFATVERLTTTQAILSNGTKLINEPVNNGYDNSVGFSVYGDRWNKWHMETPEMVEEAKIYNDRRKKINWFNRQQFTDEYKILIYELLKPEQN